MKKIIYSILILISCLFSVFSLDRLNLVGTFTSPFPYPYRFEILNNHEMKLKWTETGKKYRSWEKSKIYNYSLTEDSIFLMLKLDEDIPNSLWFPIDGNPEPWEVGNELLGLFGVNEETGAVLGVTYARDKHNSKLDSFTIDVPNYIFTGPPSKSYPLRFRNPSSELKEGDKVYELRNLDLVISDHSWVEGTDGNGIEESFELVFTESPKYLAVINGYISASNPSLYEKNGRIKEVSIKGLTTGITITRNILDTPHLQTIDIRELENETIAKFSISDVYPGSKYSDTSLHFMSYSDNPIKPLSMFKSNN